MNPRLASALNWAVVISIVLSNTVVKPSGGFEFYAIAALVVAIPSIFGRKGPRIVGSIVLAISLVLAFMTYPEYKAADERHRQDMEAAAKELMQPPSQQTERK